MIPVNYYAEGGESIHHLQQLQVLNNYKPLECLENHKILG